MRSLPWVSIAVAYMFGLFVTFLQSAPDSFDRCYQFSYCTSLAMENFARSLVWPAYLLVG